MLLRERLLENKAEWEEKRTERGRERRRERERFPMTSLEPLEQPCVD